MDDRDAEAQRRQARQKSMRVAIVGLHDDHDAIDREYFRNHDVGEKIRLVTSMFHEQWKLMGGDAEQLRLRRDIACLQRRRR